MPGSVLFGAVTGPAEGGLLAYLDRPAAITNDILALAGPASPTQVFRFAAPCVTNGCAHFDGENCRLATRIVRMLPTVVDSPPTCALRPACRWRRQEGDASCLRCPMVVTESYGASEVSDQLRVAADPATPV